KPRRRVAFLRWSQRGRDRGRAADLARDRDARLEARPNVAAARAAEMTPERWQQVSRIYHDALARGSGERASLVREACQDDEARLLASLNHPHIAAIYGFEESAGVHALVLELVEGPTLAERLQRAPLPIAEAVRIARQIADALEAAHERGVVHRDLKPQNIKVKPDGTVKVLDFGLAKAAMAAANDADVSPESTAPIDGTREGVILGTTGYMSPEQSRGHAVDKRTDIWAFGCVFYEILTGRAAFAGETIYDTVAAVLKQEPDWQPLPADTPPG